MSTHEWRDETEDGQPRLVRAVHHGGRWRLSVRLPTDPGFVELDPPPLDDLVELRDVLWRKYQRGRVPHELVARLDALIEKRRAP